MLDKETEVEEVLANFTNLEKECHENGQNVCENLQV